MFVSGGPDATVKIFNVKKEIFKEVRFPQPVTGVVFMNPAGDLMISHNEKVSVVYYTELQMPKRPTRLTTDELAKFVARRQKATWKTFARMKLYEDSLKDKGVADEHFAKMVEEEEDRDFFGQAAITGQTGMSSKSRLGQKSLDADPSSAIDLAELNVVLDKEQEAKLKKFQEYKENKKRQEEIMQMPPEEAYEEMAAQITNE